jgi:hypothetical protein
MRSKRTISETILLSAWVAAYAALVGIFRLLRRFETRGAAKPNPRAV